MRTRGHSWRSSIPATSVPGVPHNEFRSSPTALSGVGRALAALVRIAYSELLTLAVGALVHQTLGLRATSEAELADIDDSSARGSYRSISLGTAESPASSAEGTTVRWVLSRLAQ